MRCQLLFQTESCYFFNLLSQKYNYNCLLINVNILTFTLGMSASWATPGSVIDTRNQMDDDSKILRQKKFEQQRAIQQQRQQQKRQVYV